MELNIVFFKALGLTILHSVWQVTLIAVVMSIILVMVPRYKASIRYTIALSSLLLSFLVSLVTFYQAFQTMQISKGEVLIGQRMLMIETQTVQETTMKFSDQLNVFLMANLEWIFIIWSIGMILFFGKIAVGLYFQQQLQKSALPLNSGILPQLLKVLQDRTNFPKRIGLKVSDRIAGPAVMGWIKPCIYFPVTLVNQITVEDAEAILSHEIAHIIRRDYLINIFQNIVEAFFYFHPAIWWISAHIRNERENACDDLAIDIIGDNLRYAKSLVFLQEWQNKNENPLFAMSFSSPSSPLFERIKRILNQPKTKKDMKQKFLASAILLFAFVLIAATKTSFEEKTKESKQVDQEDINLEKEVYYITDTIPQKQNQAKSRIVELEDGKITKLQIDGKEIPESEFHKYEEEIEKLRLSEEIIAQQRMIMGRENDRFDIEFRMTDSLMKNLNEFHIKDLESEVMFLQQRLMEEMKEKSADFQFHHMDEYKFEADSLRIYFDSIGSNLQEQIAMSMKNFEPHMYRFFDTIYSKDWYHKLDRSLEDLESKLPYLLDTLIAKDIFDKIKLKKLDSFYFPQFDHDFEFHFDTLSLPFLNGETIMFNTNLEGRLTRELKTSGLYQEGDNTIELRNDALIINDQKQSKEMLKRFKDVYEESTGTKFLEGSVLKIVIDGKDNKKYKYNKI